MQIKGKALFNLLRINWLEDRKSDVKPWQVENLRDLDIQELFNRLQKLGLILDEQTFYLYAENCNTPEELVDFIWIEEEEIEKYDQTYLLLFELWRRCIPDKRCLSIFCDELDHLIELYDKNNLENEEPLQSALGTLEDILDDAFDQEGNAQQVFNEVASFCAHDLERFIFDYISDQILARNETYSSELIDAFSDYVSSRRQFNLLRARLLALYDLEKSNILYGRVLEELREDPNLELNLLVAESLIRNGDVRLFMQAVKQALPFLQTEEEFQNLLTMIAEYYRCLDRDEEENSIKNLLQARTEISLEAPVDPADQTLIRVSHLVCKHTS